MKKTFFLIMALWVLTTPTANAQFTYTTNNGAITIEGYTGSHGAAVIPSAINGLPVTLINDYAFSGDTNLTSITIPGTVTGIGAYGFLGCTNLTNVVMGNGVNIIAPQAFAFCPALASVTFPESLTIIKGSAFFNCASLASVTIPGSLVRMETFVFSGCKSLTNVVIGNGLNSVPDYTFDGCAALSSVVIPDSVASIGYAAFSACSNLARITIPNSVTSIGQGAFDFCVSLTNVSLGSNLSSIPAWAFQCCSNLGSVTIPNSVTNIAEFAFQSCVSLTNVILGSNVSAIGVLAFQYCTLPSITFPNSVANIGVYAFDRCSNLVSVTIPKSVTNIGYGAFANGPALRAIGVDQNNPAYTSIGGVLFNRIQTALMEYPIGNAATSYTIPGTVTTIGEDAFWSSPNLASLTIPASVTNIGSLAFADCANLAKVYFLGNAPFSDQTLFQGDTNATVHYLAGTTGWGTNFAGRRTEALNGIAFTANATNGVFPLTIVFTSGNADAGGNPVTTWNWSFGDGATSIAQNPTHTYTIAGIFSPALFGTNSAGATLLGAGSPSIFVLNAIPPQPSIASVGLSGHNLVFNGENAVPGGRYYVLTSTNLSLPLSQWTPVAISVPITNGNFSVTVSNTASSAVAQRFYILQTP